MSQQPTADQIASRAVVARLVVAKHPDAAIRREPVPLEDLGARRLGVNLTDRHSGAMMSFMAEQAHSHFVTLSTSRGSITLPAEVRRRHHLDQPGAQVEIVERDDGVIELHPLLPHRADQAWFWTKRWQAMEQEAENDITAGRVETFDSTDEFVADLEREANDRGLA